MGEEENQLYLTARSLICFYQLGGAHHTNLTYNTIFNRLVSAIEMAVISD